MRISNKDQSGRIFMIFILILFTLVIVKVVFLETSRLLEINKYKDPEISKSLNRGSIYDRNGNLLSLQAPEYGFIISEHISSPIYVASIIQPYVSLDVLPALKAIDAENLFFPLNHIPSDEEITYFNELIKNYDLESSVTLSLKDVRRFPFHLYAKEIIGEVDSTMDGLSGLEKEFNEKLSARPKLKEKNIRGENIILTLDIDLQIALENYELEGTNIIFNKHGEILSYIGQVDDKLLSDLILSSIKSNGEVELYKSNNLFTSYENELIKIGSYFIFSENNDDKIKSILFSLGKISNSDLEAEFPNFQT